MAHGRPDAFSDSNGIGCEDDVNQFGNDGVPGGRRKGKGLAARWNAINKEGIEARVRRLPRLEV
jgi:hypothetical protein